MGHGPVIFDGRTSKERTVSLRLQKAFAILKDAEKAVMGRKAELA
jgi:hypothetical protein